MRSPVNRVPPAGGRSNRWVPGWSEGSGWSPVTSQAADRVTVTARGPAWSESSQNTERPLATSAPPTCQPGGRSATHGTSAADGTAWAARIVGCPWPHIGGGAPLVFAGGEEGVGGQHAGRAGGGGGGGGA